MKNCCVTCVTVRKFFLSVWKFLEYLISPGSQFFMLTQYDIRKFNVVKLIYLG